LDRAAWGEVDHGMAQACYPGNASRCGWRLLAPTYERVITMSELRNRMIQDMVLAGLVEGSQVGYLRAVRQLTAYYMVSPDRLSERQVQDYLIYIRDELGIACGTFALAFAGLKFFYVKTLGYDWPLFTKKRFAGHAASGCPMSEVTRIAAA